MPIFKCFPHQQRKIHFTATNASKRLLLALLTRSNKKTTNGARRRTSEHWAATNFGHFLSFTSALRQLWADTIFFCVPWIRALSQCYDGTGTRSWLQPAVSNGWMMVSFCQHYPSKKFPWVTEIPDTLIWRKTNTIIALRLISWAGTVHDEFQPKAAKDANLRKTSDYSADESDDVCWLPSFTCSQSIHWELLSAVAYDTLYFLRFQTQL